MAKGELHYELLSARQGLRNLRTQQMLAGQGISSVSSSQDASCPTSGHTGFIWSYLYKSKPNRTKTGNTMTDPGVLLNKRTKTTSLRETFYLTHETATFLPKLWLIEYIKLTH